MPRSCLTVSIVALAAACSGSSGQSDSAVSGRDSAAPGAGGSAAAGAGGSAAAGAGGSTVPGAGGSTAAGAGGSAVLDAGDSAVPQADSTDAIVPDCRVSLDSFVCNGTTNACCSPTLQQMRNPSTCTGRELRYIASCAGDTTAVVRSLGAPALTCYYDNVSGELVGANRSSDIAHECGRDAAAGELPVCDWSTETEADECRLDAGTRDGPSDLAIDKPGPDAPLDRAYPIDATPPEVYPGLEAGVKLCPDWFSQVYRPCCPATPPDCTGKPDGYPGYLCAEDCANYGYEGQGCAAAWFACSCSKERWVCLG